MNSTICGQTVSTRFSREKFLLERGKRWGGGIEKEESGEIDDSLAVDTIKSIRH